MGKGAKERGKNECVNMCERERGERREKERGEREKRECVKIGLKIDLIRITI